MKPELRLETLLLSLFSSEELVRWLRNFVDARLVDELPAGAVSPMHLVHQTTAALQRRGLVNESFFQNLIAERPGRSADIQLTAKWWLDHPRHFLLSPYRSYVDHGSWASINTCSVPGACVCVALHSEVSDGYLERDVDAALFDAGAYDSFFELLNTLYLHYLKDRFSPLSYGREWLLARSRSPRAVAPWEWLIDARAGQWRHVSPHWLAQKSLADVEIVPGEPLEVVDLLRVSPRAQRRIYGLAVDSDDLRWAFERNPKYRVVLLGEAVLTDALPESVAPEAFRYRGIYFEEEAFRDWGITPSAGAWVQTKALEDADLGGLGHVLQARHRSARRGTGHG